MLGVNITIVNCMMEDLALRTCDNTWSPSTIWSIPGFPKLKLDQKWKMTPFWNAWHEYYHCQTQLGLAWVMGQNDLPQKRPRQNGPSPKWPNSKWPMLKMDHNQNGPQPIRPMTKMAHNQNGTWQKGPMTKMTHDQNGPWPKWPTTKTAHVNYLVHMH